MFHCILTGQRFNFQLNLKTVLVLANSVDSGEIPHYAAFHPGLHYLSKDPFT